MLSRSVTDYVRLIEALHSKVTLHPGQVRFGRELFINKRDIFGQCGRNWGKTAFMEYTLTRWGMTYPNSENYYFAPFMKQAREILWASGRLQSFIPKEWVTSVNDTEMRIRLINGSFIKLDGSDNVEAYRGVKPKGLSVFDEFKDFRPEFYGAYDPNRAAHESPLVIIGTPPERECQFLEVAKEFQNNPRKFFYTGPTSENPHISKAWLEEKKRELLAKGEEDVWQREYEALYVPGGISKVFPMFARSHVRPKEEISHALMRDRKKLEWFIVADPGAATVFAVLFAAINPYTRQVYIFDEIYETEQAKMTTRKIMDRVIEIKESLPDVEFRQIYDEAATWFANESLDHYGEAWEPTHKAQRKKEDGLSLIRDLLLSQKLHISENCEKLVWEMDNYYKDKGGKIPKMHDHLIDGLRYLLDSSFYDFSESIEYTEEKDENFRGAKISDDFPHLDDMGIAIGEDYLHI